VVDDEKDAQEAETQINLLEPEVVETTTSGKEIIKATGDEEIPEDIDELTAEESTEDESAGLLRSISAEIDKQKSEQGVVDPAEEDVVVSEDDEGNPADINKQVDTQLEEYRKLLAQEEDPGKKVKPAAFFSGQYKDGEESIAEERSPKVAKVNLEASTAEVPAGYAVTAKQVEGHQIVEYPSPRSKNAETGIRTLDDFRTEVMKKKDKRVRVPKHIRPALRNQGFPSLKVISIVPNYGLIAMFENQKGILMIGDTIEGWELVGVYRAYAEFKLGKRKHVISLNK